ncbi:MAG: hypothetical protein ACD_8C00130G0001 [uncultured bacterium]|nr:MAG: hypothetical protein ACD_8C00130G0001 [uncultured bacterium]
MYIKIKTIKNTLLLSACFFLAGINYMTYVKADNTASVCDKSVDADCDGLTDAEEKLYGTDANNTDSDGDGYSDKIEIESGYDPTKPAPGDRVTAITEQPAIKEGESTTTSASAESPTEKLTSDLEKLIEEKEGSTISNSDINELVATNLDEAKGEPITTESLPVLDTSSLKIINQTYPDLDAAAKKKQINADAEKYLVQVAYLIVSSSPKPLLSEDDFVSRLDELVEKLGTLAEVNTDYTYFLDLISRINLILPQLLNIEVPQTFADSHIKMLRILSSFTSLNDLFISANNDPVSKMILISKVGEISTLLTDFFQVEFLNYVDQIAL